MSEGLRERKKQATREALSWASIELVVERGYGGARIEDIADVAGVSLRTFRNYFSSKAEAIAARHADRIELIAGELRARPPHESLWTAMRTAAELSVAMGLDHDPRHTAPSQQWIAGLRLMVTEPALIGEMHRVAATTEATLAAAVADRTRTDPDDLYPRLVAATFLAALNTCTTQYVRADPPIDLRALLRSAITQIAAGLPDPHEQEPVP